MNRKKILVLSVTALGLSVLVIWAVISWSVSFRSINTDNAYAHADITAIAPKVAGYVTEAPVGDNAPVKAGELLFAIDERDYAAKVEQASANMKAAEAAVTNAEAAIRLQEAVVRQAEAQVASAAATQKRAAQEYARQSRLRKEKATTYPHVLRKIIRRALRFGRKLGIEGNFFADLAPTVVTAMGDAYPELQLEMPRIQKVLLREESQFSLTLTLGLKQLEGCDISGGRLEGADIFKLYDTYGFPVDLVQDWCKERGLTCDMEGFQKELEEQKGKSRAAMKTHDVRLEGDLAILADLPATQFLGYATETAEDARVVALFDGRKKKVDVLHGHGFVVLDKTPFYAESGGQVGDRGELHWTSDTSLRCSCAVDDCRALAPKRHVHFVRDLAGPLKLGTVVRAEVNHERRAIHPNARPGMPSRRDLGTESGALPLHAERSDPEINRHSCIPEAPALPEKGARYPRQAHEDSHFDPLLLQAGHQPPVPEACRRGAGLPCRLPSR